MANNFNTIMLDATQKEEDIGEEVLKIRTEDIVKRLNYTEDCINHQEPIHIFLKLKPFSKEDLSSNHDKHCYTINSDQSVMINPPKNSVYYKNKKFSNRQFEFSYVFQPEISQKDFFNATVLPCFDRLIAGENLLIFSYGITNSGKTYTMQGNSKNPGLIPRALDLLFDTIKESLETKYKYKPDKFNEIISLSDNELKQALNYKEQLLNKCTNFKDFDQTINDLPGFNCVADMSLYESSTKFGFSTESLASIGVNFHVNDTDQAPKVKIPLETKYSIWISFYEQYNDSIFDLLVPAGKKDDKRNPLKIREDSVRIPYVDGLIQVPVSNTYEAIKILKYGEKNLQKASNSINSASSRSHAIFCLKIVTISNDTTMCVNQLSFCDLAGIERSSKTQSKGKTFKEATTINSSLLSLSRCMNALMYNQKNKNNPMQVPYRENKLTRLFQAYFEGHGMLKMIVNISRNAGCFDETFNVLKFSSIANKIQINQNEEDKIQYKINPEIDDRSVAWELNETEEVVSDDDESEGEANSEEDDDEEDDGDEDTEVEETEEEEEETEIAEEEDDIEEMEVEEQPKAKKKLYGDENSRVKEKTKSKIDETKDSESKIDDEDEDMEDEDDDDEDEDDESTKCLDDSDDEHFENLSKEKLIETAKKLKYDLKKTHDAAFPYEARSELVSNWSKRLEDTVSFYESELKGQRAKVEQECMKKLELLKQLDDIENEKKIKDLTDKHLKELKKYKEEFDKARETKNYEKSVQTDKQINSLELELNETKRKLADAETSHKSAISQLKEDHNKQVNQFKSELQLTNYQQDRLKSELDLANARLEEVLANNRKKEIQILKLEDDIEQLEEVRKVLEEEAMAYDDANKDLKLEIEEIRMKYESMVKKTNELKSLLDEAQKSDNRHSSELRKKLDEINHLKAELKKIEADNAKLKTELSESQELFQATLQQHDKENQMEVSDTAAFKKPVKTKATGLKSAKGSKSSIKSNELVVEDDSDEHTIDEKKPKLADHSNKQHSSVIQTTISEDSIICYSETTENEKHKSMTSGATRKKSTLNRLTDLITKSPILESVRNRPARKTKANTISSAQDREQIAVSIAAAAAAAEKKTKKTSTTSKKASLLESFEKLGKHEELGDITETDGEMEVAAAKAKKKRGKK